MSKNPRGTLLGGIYVPKPKNGSFTTFPREGRKKKLTAWGVLRRRGRRA